jgi:hypothetical protein
MALAACCRYKILQWVHALFPLLSRSDPRDMLVEQQSGLKAQVI